MMASSGAHQDFVNIAASHPRAPSMIQEPHISAPAPHPRWPGRTQAPQRNIDEFWDKFTTKHPGKIFTILPDNLYAKRAAAHAPKGSIPGVNALASYEEARESCCRKVAKIVRECRRLNQKYRDPHFDIEADFKRSQAFPEIPSDCLSALNEDRTDFHPLSVKRVEDIFEKPQFFKDGASADDVRQGADGDCWFMSALATISNKEELVQRVCVARDEQVGVYGFVFHRDGEWISEVIDDKLYLIKENFDESKVERYHWLELQNRKSPEEEYRAVMQTGSRALYFAQCSDPNETWLPLLEKAFAKAHGDYSAIDGGFVGEGIEDLTGGVTSEIFATDILDKDKFWREELMNVNKHFLFGCGQMDGIYGERRGIQEKHAYSIMEAREIDGERLLKLRNPWGRTEWTGRWSDGSEEWTPEWMQKLKHKFGDDGVFWISYQDLLRSYQHFDRTRLFGPEWTVSQQWTSVNVPWSVDYLDTKFRICLVKPGPVVIVLSQLDDRYFQGLEGRYEFHLQFRLHKDDEEDYIVRSNGTYYMKRSVSTELELEDGNYTVLLKIKATRIPDNPTPDEVIRATCTKRREKLLSIGLSYDLAHAKGRFLHHEKEKAKQHKQSKIERKKAEMKHSYERRKRQKRRADLRGRKKAAKETRKMNDVGSIKELENKLQNMSVLGIDTEEVNRATDEHDLKSSHPAANNHHRASSTGATGEQSSSPGPGFGGRGGYNKGRDGYNAALPGALQGRGGYNRDASSSSMTEIMSSRGGYFPSPLGSPNAGSPGFTGRGGYERVPGELQGRGGYNQNMPGELQGRGGYNTDLPASFQGRDGYNDGQGTDSAMATPLTDDFRPGTPGRRSPVPSHRPTLVPIPGVRPGIHVHHGRDASMCSNRAHHNTYSLASNSDSSWDSEIDGPNSVDLDLSDNEDYPRLFGGRHHHYKGNFFQHKHGYEEDEFERDPWNAVCVLGLRVFSKDNTEVTIEVDHGDIERKPRNDTDDDNASAGSSGTMRRKGMTLDVDDSAADATSPLRKKSTGLEDELTNRCKEQELLQSVRNGPAVVEKDKQGS